MWLIWANISYLLCVPLSPIFSHTDLFLPMSRTFRLNSEWDKFRPVVFAQSPSPDWAKGKFSADSASLRLLLNLFTAEAQRTPRGAFFVCRETTTNKKTLPRGRKVGMLSSSRKENLRKYDKKIAKSFSSPIVHHRLDAVGHVA